MDDHRLGMKKSKKEYIRQNTSVTRSTVLQDKIFGHNKMSRRKNYEYIIKSEIHKSQKWNTFFSITGAFLLKTAGTGFSRPHDPEQEMVGIDDGWVDRFLNNSLSNVLYPCQEIQLHIVGSSLLFLPVRRSRLRVSNYQWTNTSRTRNLPSYLWCGELPTSAGPINQDCIKERSWPTIYDKDKKQDENKNRHSVWHVLVWTLRLGTSFSIIC